MKGNIFGVLLVMVSFSAFADTRIDRKIDVLKNASIAGDIDRLSRVEREVLVDGLDRAISVLRLDGQTPSPVPTPTPNPHDGGWRRNSSYLRNEVVAFSDDYCRTKVTEMKRTDSCSRLEGIFGSSNVWSVSVNGKCENTVDKIFSNACNDLQALSSAQRPRTEDLTVYTDDYCRSPVTVIDPGVDCNALGSVLGGMNAWSLKLTDGSCINVPDSTFSVSKCNSLQEGVTSMYENDGSRRSGDKVELFADDYCRSPVTTIKIGDNCSALGGIYNNMQVWSVNFRGQCVNIADTTFNHACETYAR